ncbi:hypothetical protein DFJ73DRAFT_777999 [Zopfochytrium polystomum]|nr:hypothetical protein DFJ73DRAFT_777999 [Zopfochytrium polystomum]
MFNRGQPERHSATADPANAPRSLPSSSSSISRGSDSTAADHSASVAPQTRRTATALSTASSRSRDSLSSSSDSDRSVSSRSATPAARSIASSTPSSVTSETASAAAAARPPWLEWSWVQVSPLWGTRTLPPPPASLSPAFPPASSPSTSFITTTPPFPSETPPLLPPPAVAATSTTPSSSSSMVLVSSDAMYQPSSSAYLLRTESRQTTRSSPESSTAITTTATDDSAMEALLPPPFAMLPSEGENQYIGPTPGLTGYGPRPRWMSADAALSASLNTMIRYAADAPLRFASDPLPPHEEDAEAMQPLPQEARAETNNRQGLFWDDSVPAGEIRGAAVLEGAGRVANTTKEPPLPPSHESSDKPKQRPWYARVGGAVGGWVSSLWFGSKEESKETGGGGFRWMSALTAAFLTLSIGGVVFFKFVR